MMNKKTTLYIIQGFIGAGKSTFSKKLSSEKMAVHLNPDECVSKLYKKSEYMNNWDACFNNTLNYLWQKAEELLKSGEDVVFDMGFWLKKDRDFAKALAKKCNSNFVHYYLYVPDEILKERIIKTRPPEWAERHIANFDKNKSFFEEPRSDEDVVVINNFQQKT